jgi:transcription elongation factor GreA
VRVPQAGKGFRMTDLEEQLAQLREERGLLADSIQNDDDIVGDQGDQAETIERVNSLNALDERIEELTRVQDERRRDPVQPSEDRVSVGTQVTIRFDDGSTDTVRVVSSILEENDADPVLTPDSPLGRAVMGASKGDRVTYESPAGETTAEVVEIKIASDD